MYLSTKMYGHEVGLSCCFRQWRAQSHCNKLHGYALAVKFTFAAIELDNNGWVVDFGGLKPLKEMLQAYFDHTLLVAPDDPKLHLFKQLQAGGVADVIFLADGVGCEKFAALIFDQAKDWLSENYMHVQLVSVEVKEHGANSATKLAQGASLPL